MKWIKDFSDIFSVQWLILVIYSMLIITLGVEKCSSRYLTKWNDFIEISLWVILFYFIVQGVKHLLTSTTESE